VILVDGLVKKYTTVSIIRWWERRSNYSHTPPPPPTTTKMTTRGEDRRRGRRRRNIVSNETKDINAPADSGTQRWGGRGWALSLLAVAMDQSELPRAMPTGAIEMFIALSANPQQANSQQSTVGNIDTLLLLPHKNMQCPLLHTRHATLLLPVVFLFMMKTLPT